MTAGITIPSVLRAGWWWGTDRQPEGCILPGSDHRRGFHLGTEGPADRDVGPLHSARLADQHEVWSG
jgi:hypothetical protein